MDYLIEQGVKVDAIITDPPYGTTACSWDSIINLETMWDKLKLLTKDNSPILLFGAQPFTSKLVMSNIKGYKHHWIWLKECGTGFQVAKYRPMMETEDVIGFSIHNKRINYYPIMEKKNKPIKYKGAVSSNGTNPLATFNDVTYISDKSYPTNVIYCKRPSHYLHPTQKPLELMKYLVETYTKKGDLILDFTSGSFTTCVAAEQLNRRSIGIELEKKYCDVGVKRLSQLQMRLDI
jgi:site-specific DNA-methyltransferase (adenine-specific)